MAAENNRKPLINDDLYNQIREKFALPKTEQGRLKYISVYEKQEPILGERLKSLSQSIAEGYKKDLVNARLSENIAQKVATALAKDIYTLAWYGYMFCDRARDVHWERDMRAAWERDYRPPTYDPNEKVDDDKGEAV